MASESKSDEVPPQAEPTGSSDPSQCSNKNASEGTDQIVETLDAAEAPSTAPIAIESSSTVVPSDTGTSDPALKDDNKVVPKSEEVTKEKPTKSHSGAGGEATKSDSGAGGGCDVEMKKESDAVQPVRKEGGDVEKTDSICAKKEDGGDVEKADLMQTKKEGGGDVEMADASTNGNARHWDHSNKRVIVHGVFKYLDNKKARKIAEEWAANMKRTGTNAEVEKVRKPPNDSFMVITVASVEMVEPFITYINTNNITNKRGHKLFAKRADTEENKGNNKRKAGDAENTRAWKRQNLDAQVEQARRPITEEEIKDKITPLWKLSDEKQIDHKVKDMIRNCARRVVQEIKGRFRQLDQDRNRGSVQVYSWVKKQRCVDIEDIRPVPSPVRNKVEFTFGYRYVFDENEGETKEETGEPMKEQYVQSGKDAHRENTEQSQIVKPPEEQSNEKTGERTEQQSNEECVKQETEKDVERKVKKIPSLGFMARGWAGGVAKPHCCANIPQEACALCDTVEDFLKDSPLLPYDSKEHKGFWRIMTIRSSRRTKQCMVIILHAPVSGGVGESVDNTELWTKERERLITVLKGVKLPLPGGDTLRVTSLFFQEFQGLSTPPPDHPVQHAFGDESMTEQLGKCTFKISPGAFFQVNTQGAEILYQLVVDKVKEVVKVPKETLLFDVCCGTGTIGLTCLREGVVGRVVGIDISEPAIRDATKNVELNGFDKDESITRFVAARAENAMSKEISKAKQTGLKFIAVVDPAREGLHTDVVKALRQNEKIDRIVYVSCNPTGSLVKDSGLLCAPPTKRYSGRAFRVTSATPVDMFPLTSHCEMVMVFDRVTDEEIGAGKK